jgi:hypothetical protein
MALPAPSNSTSTWLPIHADMTFDRCPHAVLSLECSDATIASPMLHG